MRRAFLAPIVLLGLVVSPAAADITTGLVAWYPMNGNAQDASGNGNHGTIVGGLVPTIDRFGTQFGAYHFNGLDSYIQVPSSTSLASPVSAVTQAAWVFFDGMSLIGSSFAPITMKSTSTTNAFMYRMSATLGALGAGYTDWLHQYDTLLPSFSLNQWYHVATVFDGTSVRYYVDGARIDSIATAVAIVPDTRDLTIGADFPGTLEIFNGDIDDVRIYARALTDADIAELCNCPATGVHVAPPTLSGPLSRVYPNPTRAGTTIDLSLATGSEVTLSVHDVAGRLIRTLRTGTLTAGAYTADWDGRDASGLRVPAGVYTIRLRAGTTVDSRQAVLLR